MDRYTFRGEMDLMCHTSQAQSHHQERPDLQVRPAWQVRLALQVRSALLGATGPAGAAAPAPRHVSGPSHVLPVCTTLLNKIYQGNVGLIEWMKL
jgi:hypothetical protein